MNTGVAQTAWKEYTELHLGNTGKADPIDWSVTKEAIQEEKNPMARPDFNYGLPVATIQVDTKPTNPEREYLLERLCQLKLEKRSAAHVAADKPNQPASFDALVKAITSNAYTVDQKRIDEIKQEYGENYTRYTNILFGVKWNDYTGFDHKGYDAAIKAISAEYQKARDIISVKDPIAGLDALNAFEAWNYTAPTA
jgi:hypothetical protein